MFWRFGFPSASAIDALLDKETITIEDLFQEEELLQECKSHNAKLIEFLCRPNVLASLLSYITADDLDDTKKFNCEIYAVCEAAISNTELLNEFWKLLDREAPLNPLQASYFSKVNNVFFQKKAGDCNKDDVDPPLHFQMVTFVKAQPNIIKKILTHIGTSAIADLLLKIISVEEVPEGQGVVQWLAGENLIPSLMERLEPNLEVEIHNTAAQTLLDIIAVSYQNIGPMDPVGVGGEGMSLSGGNLLVDELKRCRCDNGIVGFMLDKNAKNSTSTLTNGINIIIELIRRYCSEIEQAEYQQHQYHTQIQMTRGGGAVPSDEKLCALATDLNELLKVIGDRLFEFAGLLMAPRNVSSMETTMGRHTLLDPNGSRRVSFLPKCCTSREEEGKEEGGEEGKVDGRRDDVTVSDELSVVTEGFVESKILPMCLELFFQYPWNNFLHSVVYDMIAKVFNTYSFTSTANFRPMVAEGDVSEPSVSLLAAEEIEEGEGECVQILVDGRLTERIAAAQRLNDYEVEQPKGVRLGYMGHLTYISDEVCKLIDKCAGDFDAQVKGLIVAEEWQEYLGGVLRETKERDRQPLGGVRPTQTSQAMSVPVVTGIGSFGTSLDESDIGVMPGRNASVRAFAADGDVTSDQFARYLCQQIVSDFPDKGLLGVDSVGDGEDVEEVEADWVSEMEVKDMDGQSAVEVVDTANIVTSATEELVNAATEVPAESENQWTEKRITDETEAPISALDTVSDLAKALPDLDSGRGSSTVTGTTTPAEAVVDVKGE
ncbi:SIT4 phosphatase-associated protein-domain-containing protein [Chytridium lagenaria]|nr:SIT4 phosphatase-associated protein-domain-containing protein [Chytridium lagenaria]